MNLKGSNQVMNPQFVANTIDLYKSMVLGLNMALPMVIHPDLWNKTKLELVGDTEGPTFMQHIKSDGDYYVVEDIDQAILPLLSRPTNNLDALVLPLIAAIIVIGDLVKNLGLDERTPLIEFVRHIRNGLGHGNKFTFEGKKTLREARFQSFVITRDLEGEKVLFGYLGPGDIFQMLDDLAQYLRTMPAWNVKGELSQEWVNLETSSLN
jgi:hypothetical protein